MSTALQETALQKVKTGINGLDEITFGGLPKGRPTLVIGNAGSGKTMMAMEFIVRGATDYNEPGVFVAFEETPKDLGQNFASRGWNLKQLQDQGKMAVDYVYIERSEIEETGEYDLEGLFIRLAHSVDKIGAKRIVLDTIEVLFSGLSNEAILRAELRRLFRWIKDRGLTAIVTGERGETTLTRYGLEEYVADCVIILDHRVVNQIGTRRMRILKYRGSHHGTNEYPFLIEETGISIVPITSIGLTHEAATERVSTGIAGLDEMFGGRGVYRGTSVLISGTAGTGKSSLAAKFTEAACERGEKVLYFAFEESPSQIIRNMDSINVKLEKWVKKGLLTFHAGRPTQYGLETHLAVMLKLVGDLKPQVVIVDPVSNLVNVGQTLDVKAMLARLIDFLKVQQITAIFTNLTGGEEREIEEAIGVSSLMDTWISLRNLESNGERTRGLYILKSRGMSHSNQVREFVLSDSGIGLVDVYVGPQGIVTGTQREIQRAKDEAVALARKQEMDSRRQEIDRKKRLLQARIEAMEAEYQAEAENARRVIAQEEARDVSAAIERETIGKARKQTSPSGGKAGAKRKKS